MATSARSSPCSPYEVDLATGVGRGAWEGLTLFVRPPALDRVHPEDRDVVRRRVEAALDPAGPGAFASEHRVLHDDGEYRDLQVTAFIEPGKRVSGVVLDVTAQRRGERALRGREAHLRVLAEHLPAFIWAADAAGATDYYNPPFLEYLGKTLDEMGPTSWVETLHPDDRASAARAWEHAHRTGSEFVTELRIRRARDGAYRWFVASARPLRREDGTIARWLGTVVDVHDRVESEERARERAEELETLLRAAPAAIWIAHDPECLRITGSRSAHEMLRISEAANLSKSAPDAQHLAHFRVVHQGRALAPDELPMQRAARGEEIQDFEEELVFDDGARRHLYGNAVPLRDRQGRPRGAIGAFVDVTELRLAEQERERLLDREKAARAAAEAESRAKDEFLATVSHELRTPLHAILGWTQILLSRGLPDEELTRVVTTIDRNARAQARLVDDILDVSRIVTGKLRLDARPIELYPLVQAVIESQRPAADAKSIYLSAKLDPLAGPVLGDAHRLQQVIWNLASNAVKFTPPHGMVAVALERDGGGVRLSVRDTGPGIAAEFRPFLFQPFRQADASPSRSHAGLGLGLSIVRHLVELHGGTVDVESAGPGKGSTFTVRLPLAAPGSAAADVGRPGPGAELLAILGGARILVVEDEPSARALLARIFTDRGAIVRSSASAIEALADLAAWHPDVIISDIGMPDRDGLWLIERVRALPPDRGGATPAIALTAYTGVIDKVRALRSGYDLHVRKPLDVDELVASVAALLSRGSAARSP
jgi:PAS domain S-box-containing protein